ncbi:MAG: hypothetical protein ACE5SW_13525 [Nitrososphaeraceae archaeon]
MKRLNSLPETIHLFSNVQSVKKEDASKICTIFIHEKDSNRASFCDNCIKYHKCGEEMMLSIVNSPRSGECGYEG